MLPRLIHLTGLCQGADDSRLACIGRCGSERQLLGPTTDQDYRGRNSVVDDTVDDSTMVENMNMVDGIVFVVYRDRTCTRYTVVEHTVGEDTVVDYTRSIVLLRGKSIDWADMQY